MRVVHDITGRAGSAFRAVLSLLQLAPLAFAAGDGLDGLRTKLAANDKWTRAQAVEELARAGTNEAWELVIGALADRKGEVADTAQLVLAGLREPKVLELLARDPGLRSKEPLVRVRVAERLGRLAPAPPAKWLERALRDDEPEARRMACWSIERLAREGRLDEAARSVVGGELVHLARSVRAGLTGAGGRAALCLLEPPSENPRSAVPAVLEAAWRERDPLVRAAAAALAWGRLPVAEAEARLVTLSADPVTSVRRAALEALGTCGARAGVAQLVARLSAESEERLVLRGIELLQGLSGLKHRRDPRPWNDWLRTLPADWKPGRARPAAEGEPLASRTVASLAGLPIVSRRVTFLIDLSGSIWNVRPDGKTRKDLVDERLRAALEGLSGDTRFNLIPYTGEPHPWKKELVPATPARVREAASWFEACKESGSGNLWDAALLALADPEVDTLIVLFDGAPTGGTRHRLELLVPLLLERNFARRAAFDFVLVDGSRKLERAWGELASGTGGRLVAVTF